MTTQNTLRSYDTGINGTIFTSDIQQFLDDAGNEIARSQPHRTSYTPDTDQSTLTDPVLVAMAKALWTPAVVSAYATYMEAVLKG
jgi:hypothetical protein